jgi:hypothetical protein
VTHSKIGGSSVRNLKSLALAVVGGSLVAASLSAQQTGYVQWKGVNGAWSTYGNALTPTQTWSVYTSPYLAAFKIPTNSPPSAFMPPSGTTTFGPTEDIFCVDFIHAANTGTYAANFTNLGTNAGDIGIKTRTHTLQEYLETAWLSQEILANGVSTAAAKDINGAIWQIMNGQPKYRWNGSAWDDTGINSWIAAATSRWNAGTQTLTGVNASNWVVVTDQLAAGNNTGGSQEYLTQVTPEPATMILLGTGLMVMMLGAGAVKRLSA